MRFLTGTLLLCVLPLPALAADVEAVYADFANKIKVPSIVRLPVRQASVGTSFFGGHVKFLPGRDGESTEPSGNGYRLAESSFGQLAGFTVPYPDFEKVAIDHALKTLYYDKADDSPGYNKADAAFRYKAELYSRAKDEKNDKITHITRNTATIKELWNETTYNLALAAAEGIAAALRYSPDNQGLRNAYLDVLYDIATAEVILAKELEVDALKASMGFPGYIPERGGFAINPEIENLRKALDRYRAAAQPYFNLLTDRMGVGVSIGGRDLTNVAFGYHLFLQQQPSRSFYAATFRDTDGNLKSVLDESQPKSLFTGYKDLVLLFEIERESARVAAKLAKLLALRGDTCDREEANKVVGEAQQRGYTDGQVLNGMFKESDLLDVDGSGLKEARVGWAQALTGLSGIKSFLDGKANPLGLDPNFLALVQYENGDTFDYFKNHFLGGDNDALPGAIQDALKKWEKAKDSYEKFQQYQDRIGEGLGSHRGQFAGQLAAIAGCEYRKSCYDTPENNTGGKIYLQLQNIELAKQRIEKNAKEIANLKSQIANEIERRGREVDNNKLMADTYVDYGDRQATLTEQIAQINAEQAAANSMAQAVSSFATGKAGLIAGYAHGVNSGVQAGAEIEKGILNSKKERLSAELSAKIIYINDKGSADNSKALVKNLWLGMSILSIESTEASISLAQEVGQLQALLDEKSYLETQWAEANEKLGQRYFADPTHRIIQNLDILKAGQAFDRAQLWVFIMARALEYKWNKNDLTYSGTDGKEYSAGQVFKLRNAKELDEMVKAMLNFDQRQNLGRRYGGQFVSFSLKDDFLGHVDETAFQSYLEQHIMPDDYKPSWGKFQKVVRLRFSTAKSNPGETFFSPGRWNEKIDWVAVNIVAGTKQREVMVYLEQSGNAFIRNDTGNIVIYPVRYWHTGSTCQSQFCSKNAFGQAINAVVTPHSMAPPETHRKKEFHEMSPAISTWILEIPIIDNDGNQLLKLNEVADIEICFKNYYYTTNPDEEPKRTITQEVQTAK